MHTFSEIAKVTAEVIAGAILLAIYLGVTVSKSRKGNRK